MVALLFVVLQSSKTRKSGICKKGRFDLALVQVVEIRIGVQGNRLKALIMGCAFYRIPPFHAIMNLETLRTVEFNEAFNSKNADIKFIKTCP